MTYETLNKANSLQQSIQGCRDKLKQAKNAASRKVNDVGMIYCSESNPFVIAALNFEIVTLEQRIRELEKDFAEL